LQGEMSEGHAIRHNQGYATLLVGPTSSHVCQYNAPPGPMNITERSGKSLMIYSYSLCTLTNMNLHDKFGY
jgi:hypothetical protein